MSPPIKEWAKKMVKRHPMNHMSPKPGGGEGRKQNKLRILILILPKFYPLVIHPTISSSRYLQSLHHPCSVSMKRRGCSFTPPPHITWDVTQSKVTCISLCVSTASMKRRGCSFTPPPHITWDGVQSSEVRLLYDVEGAWKAR